MTCSAIHRQGSYKLVESDEQWQAVQQHRGGGTQHRQHRGEQYLQQQQQHYQHEVGSQVGGGHVSRRASGYVNSGAETETEMGVGTSSMRRNRRRQRWVRDVRRFTKLFESYPFPISYRSVVDEDTWKL